MRAITLCVLITACGPGSGTATDTTPTGTTTGTPTGSTPVAGCGELVVGVLEPSDPMSDFFDRCTLAFGLPTYAAPSVPDDKLLHTAWVAAEWLDNDEDGVADDADVIDALADSGAYMVVFADEQEFENSPFLDDPASDGPWQPTWVAEMDDSQPPWFDATYEEVLHLVQVFGLAMTYPDAFAFWQASDLTEAMDVARGGHFTSIPDTYPDGAWYHYDDWTCDYGCMAVEYLYWATTTRLGMQSDPQRCQWIANEWELCDAAALQSTDTQIWALLTDPAYAMPTVAPDGVYAP